MNLEMNNDYFTFINQIIVLNDQNNEATIKGQQLNLIWILFDLRLPQF